MRLAFVAHPNSIHTRRWVGWFARAGHDVTLVDPVGIEPDPGLPEGVPVVRQRRGSGLLGRRRAMRDLLRQLGPDVVHAHYLARFGWTAALAGAKPLVVSPWGSDLLQIRRTAIRTRLWNRFALRSAHLVTVSSEGMREAAIDAGANPDRIRLIHHGVDTGLFSPAAPAPAFAARVDARGGPVVVSPRTVKPLYRHDVVIDAVAELARHGTVPVLMLSAIGADPSHLVHLRRRAEAKGIGGQLRVLDGVRPEELPDLYRIADVVVSVPETDSFSVTVLEAMACERPIVTSDLPAVTPVLGALDPVARELLVPVGDVGATARAIRRALALPADDRRRLGWALRHHVVETAEYDTNMAAMERLYRELADRSGG